MLTLYRQTRCEALIFAQQLDHQGYNRVAVYQALKLMALRSLKAAPRLPGADPLPHLQERRYLAENPLAVDENGDLHQPLHSPP